jgi:hypothetical protein
MPCVFYRKKKHGSENLRTREYFKWFCVLCLWLMAKDAKIIPGEDGGIIVSTDVLKSTPH